MKGLFTNLLIVAIMVSGGIFYKHASALKKAAQQEPQEFLQSRPTENPAPALQQPMAVQNRAPASALATLAPSQPTTYTVTETLPQIAPAQEESAAESVSQVTYRPVQNKKANRSPQGNGPRGFENVIVITNYKSARLKQIISEGPTFGFKLGIEQENETNPRGFFEAN